MDRQYEFDRIVASLHECSLNPGCWDRTAALLTESLGLAHHHVAVVSGSAGYLFGRMDFDGRPRPDLERNFAAGEFALDERTPRIVALPHARVVSGNDLWTEHEKRRSYIYNRYFQNSPEFPGRTIDQLLLRLDVGPAQVGWCLGRTADRPPLSVSAEPVTIDQGDDGAAVGGLAGAGLRIGSATPGTADNRSMRDDPNFGVSHRFHRIYGGDRTGVAKQPSIWAEAAFDTTAPGPLRYS